MSIYPIIFILGVVVVVVVVAMPETVIVAFVNIYRLSRLLIFSSPLS